MAANKTNFPLATEKEIQELRHLAAQAQGFKLRIQELEKTVSDQARLIDQQSEIHHAECRIRAQAFEELQMAKVIIDKSPVILFRRLAAEIPKLVYVSDNIAQWGYTPNEFLSGQLTFKGIVFEDDRQRTSAEIKAFAEADVEEYSQSYDG
jgi:sigma-B regulation protein RsbU (phosphoserine phosphatase)